MKHEYTVELEAVFRGPMDLLLHLVKEQEVEIQEVEISRVIDGYFAYLDTLEELDLEVAGEFLVVAATLMSIKARSLLPREEVEIGDTLDPEDELIQRLIEYRRFKEASDHLEACWLDRGLRRERGFHDEVAEHAGEKSFDLTEVTPWDLLGAFSRLLRETLANRPHRVRGEGRPLRWYVNEVGRILHSARSLSLRGLLSALDSTPSKEDLIGAFCALLELMKLGFITARQDNPREDIELALCQAALDADVSNILAAATFMDEEIAEVPGAESVAQPEPEPGTLLCEEPLDDDEMDRLFPLPPEVEEHTATEPKLLD